MVESPSSVAQKLNTRYGRVTGVIDNIPLLVCGLLPEHGLLDRESVRRLIGVSIDFLPIASVKKHLGEPIGSIKF